MSDKRYSVDGYTRIYDGCLPLNVNVVTVVPPCVMLMFTESPSVMLPEAVAVALKNAAVTPKINDNPKSIESATIASVVLDDFLFVLTVAILGVSLFISLSFSINSP